MKFWDASAIVPLLVGEPATKPLQALASRDPVVLVWWGTEVECASAIERLERDAALDTASFFRRSGGTKWNRAMRSAKPRCGFCACIRCAPPMPFNSRPRSSPPSDALRRSNWSRSTSVWPARRAKKDSCWLKHDHTSHPR